LDTFGHVNNATYLQLLEDARWEWITAGGYGLGRVKELQQGPTILQCSLEFRRELHNRTKVLIRSWVDSYVGKIGRVTQEIRFEDGSVACTASFVVGLFDLRARKLVEPTDEWLEAVGLSRSAWKSSG
jgi:acyl-CoA thioester hydrolase